MLYIFLHTLPFLLFYYFPLVLFHYDCETKFNPSYLLLSLLFVFWEQLAHLWNKYSLDDTSHQHWYNPKHLPLWKGGNHILHLLVDCLLDGWFETEDGVGLDPWILGALSEWMHYSAYHFTYVTNKATSLHSSHNLTFYSHQHKITPVFLSSVWIIVVVLQSISKVTSSPQLTWSCVRFSQDGGGKCAVAWFRGCGVGAGGKVY